jgi:DNA-binding CsgD family transcriptional regulator
MMSRSVEGVFVIDAGQTIVFWNQASEGLTGIPAGQAVGRCCHEVLKGHDLLGRPVCKGDCPVGSLAHGGPPPAQLPMRITHADGQAMQLNVGTMLIPSSRREQWDVVHVMRRGRECGTDGLLGCHSRREAVEAASACPAPDAGACLLTSREREILRLLAKGIGIDSMSEHLNISVTTVRNHIQRMLAKLNVHSRLEAVAYAHRHQLV